MCTVGFRGVYVFVFQNLNILCIFSDWFFDPVFSRFQFFGSTGSMIGPVLVTLESTNPKDQFGGERSHPTWSKLGHGGERFLPHHSTSDPFRYRGFLHQPQVQRELECSFRRVSSRRAHHLGERSSFHEIGRASGGSSTWVFIGVSWPLDLVHSGGVLCAI
jgi:hypothetical protein